MYFIYYLYFLGKLIFRALTKLNKSKHWGAIYLQVLENKFNGKFENKVFDKVAKYQSIQLHFVANTFSGLFNRVNNKIEEERNIQFFLMSVLYDELIDSHQFTEFELNELFYHPELTTNTTFEVQILVAIHLKLLNEVQNKEGYWKTLEQLHVAQKASKLQLDPTTKMETILDITKRKGGFSLLICRHYLIDPEFTSIDNCWYALGGLIQMTNDLYDTYKDTQEGIHTFANKLTNIDSIKNIYLSQLDEFNKSIKNLPVSKKHKIEFAIQMGIIPSFGLVAIEQLKKLPSEDTNLPNFKKVNRKDLIIDMEKPINILRLIRYTYTNGKLWM